MPIAIAGLILSVLVLLPFGGAELDRGLLTLFAQPDLPRVESAAAIVSWIAGPFPLLGVVTVASGYLAFQNRWMPTALLVGTAMFGWLLVHGVQLLTEGVRPAIHERMLPTQHGSYPSGAAARATIAGFALAFLLPSYRTQRRIALACAVAFAVATGLAALLLGQSWATDIVGGWALGLAWTLLLLWLAGADLSDGAKKPQPLKEK